MNFGFDRNIQTSLFLTSPVQASPRQIPIQDLPAPRFPHGEVTSVQLADYFQQLFHIQKDHPKTFKTEVELPSVVKLAEFFFCSELDILDALQDLKQQGYDYRLQGLTRPFQILLPSFQRFQSPPEQPELSRQKVFLLSKSFGKE